MHANDRSIATGVLTDLAPFGKGWGFGMLNGLSDVTFTFGVGTPQEAGSLNFWSGRDQL